MNTLENKLNDKMPELSVVIPMYNEADTVIKLIERLEKSLEGISYEVIFINDSSTDDTLKRLQQNINNTRLRVISLSRNRGQTVALSCGFEHSNGRYIAMMDGDLQNFPEDLSVLLNEIKLTRSDLISGRRMNRQDSRLRKLPSWFANWLIRKVTGCKVKDMGGINIMKGEYASKLHLRNGYHRLIPALIYSSGGKTREVEVRHAPRLSGVSKYKTISRMIDVIFDIIFLWFVNSSKSRPLYLLGKFSVAQFIISFIVLCYLLYERQVMNIQMGNRPVFALSILFIISGFITMIFAILAELIIENLHNSKKTRKYSVEYDSLIES
jgi:glycosyltransferase involved in cell wall biosynthesis